MSDNSYSCFTAHDSGWLYRQAKSMANDHAAVDDLMQEGAIAMMKANDSFDPSKGASLKGWRRHKARFAMLNLAVPAKPPPIPFLHLTDPPPVLPTYRDDLVPEWADNALLDLPEHVREVAVEAYVDGRSVRDIAEDLNCGEANIYVRLKKAKAALRAAYVQAHPEELEAA